MGATPHPKQEDGGREEDKKSLEPIDSRFQHVLKSGQYVLGYKQTLKMVRQGKAKLVILASGTQPSGAPK